MALAGDRCLPLEERGGVCSCLGRCSYQAFLHGALLVPWRFASRGSAWHTARPPGVAGVTTSVSRGGILTACWLSWPSLASDIKTLPCHRLSQKPVLQLAWPWLHPNVDVTRLMTGLALAPIGQAYAENLERGPQPPSDLSQEPVSLQP